PLVVIEAGARIGARALVGALSYVGAGVEIGEECVLGPHVTLLTGTRFGRRVLVHPGAVIGADGFGFALDGAWYRETPHTGGRACRPRRRRALPRHPRAPEPRGQADLCGGIAAARAAAARARTGARGGGARGGATRAEDGAR